MAQITTHRTDAIERLVAQYKGKPRMEGLAGLLGDRAQTIENAIWGISSGLTLAGAVGAQLDLLGEVLGEKRNGLSDAVYRALLGVRVLINRSSGGGNELLDILEAIAVGWSGTGESFTFASLEEMVASVWARFSGAMSETTAGFIARLLREARGGGIQGVVQWSSSADDYTFEAGMTAVSVGGGWNGQQVVLATIQKGWPDGEHVPLFVTDATNGVTFLTHGQVNGDNLELEDPVRAEMTGVLWFAVIDAAVGIGGDATFSSGSDWGGTTRVDLVVADKPWAGDVAIYDTITGEYAVRTLQSVVGATLTFTEALPGSMTHELLLFPLEMGGVLAGAWE